MSGYYAASKVIDRIRSPPSRRNWNFEIYGDVAQDRFGLKYRDQQTEQQVKLYAEKTVIVNNYSASYYDNLEKSALEKSAWLR